VFKNLKEFIQRNLAEMYVGVLLFVGVPAIGWLFFDWRVFVATTIIVQTIFGVLYLRKDGK